jgi:hypothetical protein
MNWLEEVRAKLKKGNNILFAQDCEFLQELTSLIQEQNHRTAVLWAFELADETVATLNERYPGETRFTDAVAASKDWAAGRVKMPVAQRAILQCHAVAKKIDSLEDIALCHAIGQACGVVHAPGHAMGFPLYELTALVRRYGIDSCKEPIEQRMDRYIERLLYWSEHYEACSYEWATFMMRD